MGRPSDSRHTAQRPGKSERARVKKPRRTTVWMRTGREPEPFVLKAGRKKSHEFWVSRRNPFSSRFVDPAPSSGDPLIAKVGTSNGEGPA